jgi:hypothetical protein
MNNQVVRKIIGVFALVGLVMAGYLLWARPYQLRWGATDEEVNRAMPGDELDSHPAFLATRAITINGTPEEIWPWLLQMGYRRAGYYGYDIFENLGSPRGIRSAVTILPEFQHFKVGDEVPISPAGGLVFYAIEPYRYLIWSGGAGWGGFTWALYPVDSQHTRLVSRVRWTHHWSLPVQLVLDLITEFSDHLAIRKILQGVKGRVENRIEPMAVGNTEFAIYLVSALIFLAGVILNVLCPFTWQGWLSGLAAGAAWLITWYAPVPIWTGALLELLVLWGLLAAFHRPAWQKPV